MSEKRFTIQKASGMYLHLPIFDNGVEMADEDVCILLNEQQAIISKLEEENEHQHEEIINSHKAYVECLNENKELKEENEQLRKELLICQQSKNDDDGRFQVWEVPPIPKGTRITFSTTERSGKNE